MAKTISFVKEKGNINHNNRVFVTENVDSDRIKDNIIYVQQALASAYTKLFEEAINKYNEKQTRNDRKYGSVEEYMTKLNHSKNGENIFYENIVQIGDMNDSGIGTDDGNICVEILNEYALSFQERNPHLHVFNMILHMDEKTPHLHIDYIPVATGYSQGLKVRNSLSKALENQKFSNEKRNKYQNSLLSWQKNEREILRDISREHGIETTELGLKRDDMELEVYKIHASLEDTKKNLNKITGEVESLKDQSDYYEERLIGIEDIKYSMFSGKQAEEDNKALQYENIKLKNENEKLNSKVNELQKAAEYWNLMCKGIRTFKDEKKKSLKEMVSNLIKRGKDPLQAAIDDKKELINSYTPSMIKNNNTKEKHYLEREER